MNIYRYEFEYKVYNNDGLEVDKGIETSKGYDEVKAENYLRTRLEEGCQSDEEVEIKLIPKLVKYVDANKLIAEFMGWNTKSLTTIPPNLHLSNLQLDNGDVMELQFHTSWDWLMPVVGKCLEKHNNLIDGRDVIDTSYSSIAQALQVVSRKETYKAVVEFIKEHNQNT